MSYQFGGASRHNLIGVHPKLIEVDNLAITLSTQDYCIYEGLRTYAQQHKNIQKGVSQTMDSMHLPQFDGLAHATDNVPWINGKPDWNWEGCYKIASAMSIAAHQLNVAKNIRWGGCWDKRLSDFGSTPEGCKAASQDYVNRRRHAGLRAFLDGPHFEWRD